MRLAVFALFVLVSSSATAQVVSPAPIDTKSVATKADIAALQAAMPQPATTVPPIEVPAGTVGTAGTYRPADSAMPRITRAGSCALSASGTCTVTWSLALPASANSPNVIVTPINTGSQPISCNLTAVPTATSASIRCWTSQTTSLTLPIVTAGLTLAPNVAAAPGTVVQVTALPATQAAQ